MPKNWRSVASRLLTVLLVGTWAAPASAVQYETEIEIENEQDLYDLQLEGSISETTLETLLDLFRAGVDLNTADTEELYELPNITYAQVRAILAYRKQAGRIESPENLVVANAISPKQLSQLAPFLVISDADARNPVPFSGRAEMGVGYSNADSGGPPVYLRTQVKGPFSLTAGLLALTTRRMLGEVSYDTERERLSAEAPSYAFHLPKLYLQWKKTNYAVLVGNFRIGFGERLVLDNSTRSNPDGFYADDAVYIGQDLERRCKQSAGDLGETPCTEEDNASYVTPDFGWRDGFRGVAARVDAPLGELRLKATVFGSYQSRSLYQYEIYDGRDCDDPHNTGDECKSPSVYEAGVAEASKYSWTVLPDIYDELAGGGNLTVKIGGNGHVGVTGYFARTSWQGDPMELDFQEWSRTPFGGPYGAMGLNGGVTLGMANLFLEAARSFDSMPAIDRDADGVLDPAGGGFGLVQRTTLSALAQEFELTLRYYDRNFANPYSRATAAPDEYEGQRARNEAGARLRYRGVSGDWVLSADTDFWLWPENAQDPGTAGTRHLSLKGQVKYAGFNLFQPFVSLEYKNKDLDNNADSIEETDGDLVGACYETGDEENPDGTVRPCSGSFYRAAAGVKVQPLRELSFDVRYQHELLNDVKHSADLRQDSVVRATVAYRPIDSVWIRARLRYLNEDLAKADYLEESLWSYLQVTYVANKQLRVGLRYDLYNFLDQRDATLARANSPEQRGRIELEAKF